MAKAMARLGADEVQDMQAGAASASCAQEGVLRIPAFEALPWLRAGFSTREHGVSTVYRGSAGIADAPPELNLGWTGDDPDDAVAENRERLTSWVRRGAAMQLVTMRQFHSGMIRIVERDHGALTTPNGRAVLRGDGLMTDVPGLLLGVQTADCVPVLLADRERRVVAVFHAGWRGTVARIVERGVGLMRLRYGSEPSDLVAAVGPAIGACCFAVGEEVREQFESQFAYGAELFQAQEVDDPLRRRYPLLFGKQRASGLTGGGSQLYMDLFEANRRQLVDAGLAPGNIIVTGECSACTRTASGARKYFSHRDERGFTGRMMSVLGTVSSE